jgi:hypothetical protein
MFNMEASGQTRLAIHGLSAHYDAEKTYNNQNPGLAIQRRLTSTEAPQRVAISLGVYHNSIENVSSYVALEWAAEVGPIGIGVVGQVATGYRQGTARLNKGGGQRVQVKGPGRIVPLAFLTTTADLGRVRFRILSAPSKLYHLMMSVRL